MAVTYKFSLLIVAVLISMFCIRDSEGVYGILVPKEGKRGFEKQPVNRKMMTLQAMRQKLQRQENFYAILSKLVSNRRAIVLLGFS